MLLPPSRNFPELNVNLAGLGPRPRARAYLAGEVRLKDQALPSSVSCGSASTAIRATTSSHVRWRAAASTLATLVARSSGSSASAASCAAVAPPPIAQGPCSTGVELCPGGIAAGAGAVWVTNARLGLVYRIDPRRGAVVARIQVRRPPIAIAVGAGRVWTLVR
jgi:hypothetical protein